MKKTVSVLLFAMSGLASSGIAATVTLTYTGNDFGPGGEALTPYTTSDSVSGSLTLSSPLDDNLDAANVSPSSFSFTDGVNSINDATTVDGTCSQFGRSCPQFVFSTDSAGNISGWYVLIQDSDGEILTNGGSLTYLANGDPRDVAVLANGIDIGENSGAPGYWTQSETASAPEPSSISLLGAALSLIAMNILFSRRDNRPHRIYLICLLCPRCTRKLESPALAAETGLWPMCRRDLWGRH